MSDLTPGRAASPRSDYAPTQPEAVAGTDAVLREAARHSLVSGRLAGLRTQAFTGLAVIGLLVFSGLTALVTDGLTANTDLAVTQAVQGLGWPWVGPLMLGISLPGFFPQNVLLVVGVVGIFWRSGYRTEATFALAACGSSLLTEAFKRMVARPRPDAELVAVVEGASGMSFPSGHTLFYVTFMGFLAYLAYAHLRPRRVRTLVLSICGLLIVLIGPSRIWMGQHWASDVLASYALGLAYLVALVWLYGRRRLRTVRAPT